MAIISIPTSIGGVTIPGAAINGPLGSLYQNKFGRQDLAYPRDLQSATRGHYIKFEIFETIPGNFKTVTDKITNFAKDLFSINSATAGAEAIAGSAAADALGYAAASVALAAQPNSISDFFQDPQGLKKLINFTEPNKTSRGSITLYIPDTVNFTYNAQYGKLSLADAFRQTPIISKVAKPVVGALQNNAALKLILRGEGLAFNPQQQILFDGIDFRTYQMAFTFTPYSKQEAETVEKIIKLFKFHAAPRLANFGAGMFFVPPSTFKPQFFFNNQENKKLNKITESVIESIDVNYAPNGFSTMSDGSATQIQLTISFKEIELLTRDKIDQGY